MRQAIDGVIFDTEKATLLANTRSDVMGGMRKLYRTADRRYFVEDTPELNFIGETVSTITPLDVQGAIKAFNTLSVRLYDFNEAFPDVEFIDA